MPRAPSTVLEAGLSYQRGSENRLTAIFAAVLDQHYRLASELFELLELPTAERYRAYTEIWVTPTRRVDMQVIARDAAGGDVAQVWSEHKGHGGAFSTGQREDYLAALEAQGDGLSRSSRTCATTMIPAAHQRPLPISLTICPFDHVKHLSMSRAGGDSIGSWSPSSHTASGRANPANGEDATGRARRSDRTPLPRTGRSTSSSGTSNGRDTP